MISRVIGGIAMLLVLAGAIILSADSLRDRGQLVASIPLAEFQEQLAYGDDLVLLDIRTEAEAKNEPINLAVDLLIPLQELPLRKGELIGHYHRTIVALCPNGQRSREAARLLRHEGYQATYLENGLESLDKEAGS